MLTIRELLQKIKSYKSSITNDSLNYFIISRINGLSITELETLVNQNIYDESTPALDIIIIDLYKNIQEKLKIDVVDRHINSQINNMSIVELQALVNSGPLTAPSLTLKQRANQILWQTIETDSVDLNNATSIRK